ncbi:MAG: hypothetical protein AB1467_02325 [Candidatus Diapherotrites archaeon]
MLKDLISRMKSIKDSFCKKELVRLRNESNELIELAALHSDKVLAEMSLIAYSLQKILSKPHIIDSVKWENVKSKIIGSLDESIERLKRKDFDSFKKELNELSRKVSAVDKEYGNFIQNVFEKAKVKQASRAYALGLSLSQSADLTGASKKELLSYIGATKIHDAEEKQLGIKERKELLGGLFRDE